MIKKVILGLVLFSAVYVTAAESNLRNLLQNSGLERDVVKLIADYDGQPVWSTELADCRPDTSYLFSADFFRHDRRDNLAYPVISLWGREYRLDTHRMTGKFQRLKAIVTCPESYSAEERVFQFHNNYPGNTFLMRSPELTVREQEDKLIQPPPKSSFFPIGTYGAGVKNLRVIKKLGLNTAVVAMNRENIEECLSLGIHCTLAVARDPDKLSQALDELAPLLEKGRFDYYVNDEPGIHSFPEEKAENIRKVINERFPDAITSMAIVRPQVIPFYEKSSDYFMLDQYPVPNMPISWLADSMDEAAGYVGRGRLQSVIQAFGGEKYASSGWSRLPTFAEMNCLAFLSVIHGSRGIYFYTFPAITSTVQGKADFVRLIRRLNSLRSWLLIHNDKEEIVVNMTSKYRFDPAGKSAVHCVGKEQYNTRMLICANTISTYTEAEISVAADRQINWQDYFTGTPYTVTGGTVFSRFNPLEVKVLIESR